MQLSLSSHLLVYGRCEPEELVSARAAGIEQLELWLAEPHLPWRDLAACAALRKRLGDLGLRAGSVHLPFYPSVPELLDAGEKWSLIDPDPRQRAIALDGVRAGMQAAADLGAEHAVLHLGWQRDSWTQNEHGWAREAVHSLLSEPPANGVQLCLENIISSGTRAAALMQLLDEVDPEGRAGICLDLGHAHVDGGVLAELECAAPRLCHLHLHDNDGQCDAHLPPGSGTIPWPLVLAQLEAAGFDGYGALEIRDQSRGERPVAETLQETLAASAKIFPELLPPDTIAP
ncbi:MAG: sugar phosphate isomerase/epimerase [Planctomycetes bacterium]|nr:sugar phosphate isomerase/epimerase [Planctomycetota bacterium]